MGNNKELTYAQRTKKFLKSKQWKQVRVRVFNKYGYRCMCCGIVKPHMHVDHIVPRYMLPMEKWLDFDNLQVLCKECNTDKGTMTIDYRSRRKKPVRKKMKVHVYDKDKKVRRKTRHKDGTVTLPSGRKLPLYANR